MEFEWDKNKAATNLSKHSVSFDEAKTVNPTSFLTIQTTLLKKIDLLPLDGRYKTAYYFYHILNVEM